MVYKKPLKYDPAAFNEKELQHFFDYEYRDRGMLKWQGFFLSDHTSALNKEAGTKAPVRLPQQNETEISAKLLHAWQNKRSVIIQLQEVDDEQIPQEIKGTVAGYKDNEIAVQTTIKEKPVMLLQEMIRNVRYPENKVDQ